MEGRKEGRERKEWRGKKEKGRETRDERGERRDESCKSTTDPNGGRRLRCSCRDWPRASADVQGPVAWQNRRRQVQGRMQNCNQCELHARKSLWPFSPNGMLNPRAESRNALIHPQTLRLKPEILGLRGLRRLPARGRISPTPCKSCRPLPCALARTEPASLRFRCALQCLALLLSFEFLCLSFEEVATSWRGRHP